MISAIKRFSAFKTIKIEDTIKKRLDVFLVETSKELNWGKVHSLIKKKVIFVKNVQNKRFNGPSHILSRNDSIFIRESEFNAYFKTSSLTYKQKPYREIEDMEYVESMISKFILFKNDNFMIINKPVGLFSQGTPILKLNISSILNTYYSYYKIQKQSFIVQRLDKPVSGIMLIATNKSFAGIFSILIKNKQIEKYYESFVQGVPSFYLLDKKLETEISELVGFNESKQKAFIGKADSSNVSRALCDAQIISAYAIKKNLIEKLNLNTDFRSVKEIKERIENGENIISHVKFKLITGKRHQLRLFAEKVLETPILYDFKYGYKILKTESLENLVDKTLNKPDFLHSENQKLQKYFQNVYHNREYIYLQSRKLHFQLKTEDKVIIHDFNAEYNIHFQLLIGLLGDRF